MTGLGFTDRTLSADETEQLVQTFLAGLPLEQARVLVLIPDGTRTAPIPQMFRLLHKHLCGRVATLDYLIALGTHQPMSAEQINKLVGVQPEEWATFKDVHVFNHEWEKLETFVTLGTISSEEVFEISQHMLKRSVDVRVNRLVTEYDHLIVCGPVFPHEVVGFSGGNKYFFPGISGPEVINLSHWLGALITSYQIIGTLGITPVRQLIDKAASFIKTPKSCLAMVVAPARGTELAGLYAGTPEVAWEEAAALSAQVHIRYVKHPFKRVLSVMPEMYDDIWTAAKGMYKLEPIVADGGELIIYAPHITEFSYTHGSILAEIGYHVRDYFLKQWDKFQHYPGGVLAHSTHLRGAGTYDDTGEYPRIQVTLATGIPRERCLAHNVGYLDPTTIDVNEWAGREDEDVLLVPKAGEILYRIGTA